MKKIILLLAIVFYFSIASKIFSQGLQSLEWIDGVPLFTHIDGDSSQNVKVDSFITLTPLDSFALQNSNFQFILFGLDWSWPNEIRIVSAEDIDFSNYFGTDLYLVTDAVGRRVVEINPQNPLPEVWSFEGILGTPEYLEKPVDSHLYLDKGILKVLITDQGRHRVINVIRGNKAIEWQYGNETEGNGFNQLSSPADAIPIPDSGKVFICDKGNNRVILVNEADTTIIWNWGLGELNNPVDIEYDPTTGDVLITDQSNHRVIKVNINSNAILWQFGNKGEPGNSDTRLNLPTDADLLSNGNVLICDAGNKRIIEVNSMGEIVWKFGRELKNLKDVDRLPDNKHLVISENLPSRLGYANTDFISKLRDIGTEVSFASLFWLAETSNYVTSIKLQLRTENTLSDLESAPWRGPTQQDSFYTRPGMPINPAHNGHRFYQFKAKLTTNNPLYTPVLNDVILDYKYFNTEKTGKIVTEIIHDSTNHIITRWKTLKFNTKLPENLANRNKVETKITILDAGANQAIRSFTASNVDAVNEVALSNIEALKQKQAIRIQATFKTNNTSVSPALNSLAIDWERAYSTASQINFVDQDLKAVDYYRLTTSYGPGQPYIDRILVFLNDANLEQVQDVVTVNINAINSLDAEEINLNRQTAGGFRLQPSIPGIIMDTGIPYVNNKIFEVFDRDTLVISYTDPTNPGDQSRDSVVIIQDTKGIIQFVNQYGDTIHSASISDSIFVEIFKENDRNLSMKQDTVSVIVFDQKNNDQEILILAEVKDSLNSYNSGHFFSTTGLPLVLSSTRKDGDGILQTSTGNTIGINYFDSIDEVPIIEVIAGGAYPDTSWNPGSAPLYFEVAPNPFYTNQRHTPKIRVSSSIGDFRVLKIEIYNLAGERVNAIDASLLKFNYYVFSSKYIGSSDNWWNLKNTNGTTVSSGTYFIKVYGKIVASNEELSEINKLLIIR